MIVIHAELKRLWGLECMMQGRCPILNLCCMMWKKKKIVIRAIMARDANHFHCFRGWCLFLHGLLVMPVVCLVNHNIKFLLFVACLMASLHHHSSTPLSDVVYLNLWSWSLSMVFISCLHQLYHLGLVPLSSCVQRYNFESKLNFRQWWQSFLGFLLH
jgi:hypothetical protein